MTQMRRFPKIGMVIQVHADLISQFGGVPGIRDAEALESALLRPWVGNYDGIAAEAAALMEGLFHYRPFFDGNKRTGFVVGILFLELNGYRFTAAEDAATQAVLGLAAGTLDEADYAAFLRANTAAEF